MSDRERVTDEKMYTGETLDTEDAPYTPQQENFAGKDNIEGSGEWPDPHTPPRAPAPGAVERDTK